MVGQDGQFTLLEDPVDDKGTTVSTSVSGARINLRKIMLDYEQSTGRLRVSESAKSWTFRFLGFMERPSTLDVRVAGNLVVAETLVDQGSESPGLVISTVAPSTGQSGGEVEITLGPNPQLSIVDRQKCISEWLLSAQIDYAMKDRVFDIVNANKPLGSKIASLLALGLEDDVTGPVLEILTADSRQ